MKKESHNQRSIFLVILLCLILPNFAGCGVHIFGVKPTLTPITHPGWLKKLLENPTCSPPCWENITPGITTIFQAQNLLPGIPEVTSIGKLYTPDSPYSRYEISWDLAGGGGGRADTASTKEPTEIIDILYFGFPPEKLRLGEVISAFGEPSHIFSTIAAPEWLFVPDYYI